MLTKFLCQFEIKVPTGLSLCDHNVNKGMYLLIPGLTYLTYADEIATLAPSHY